MSLSISRSNTSNKLVGFNYKIGVVPFVVIFFLVFLVEPINYGVDSYSINPQPRQGMSSSTSKYNTGSAVDDNIISRRETNRERPNAKATSASSNLKRSLGMKASSDDQKSSTSYNKESTITSSQSKHHAESLGKSQIIIPSPFINNVAIVGGTHGNEYTGVWIVRELQDEHRVQELKTIYPTLNITSILGNPVSHQQNKRFIDIDLNRQFSTEDLQRVDESSRKETSNNINIPLERLRAIELNEILGPKLCSNNTNMDLIIDLHTTTANMDLTLVIPEGDILMAQAAAYIMQKSNEMYDNSDSHNLQFTTRIIMHPVPDYNLRPSLSSIGKHGFTIEVGPVPQGVIRHDAIFKTKVALQYLLEFMDLYNQRSHNLSSNEQQHPNNAMDKSNESQYDQWLLNNSYSNAVVPCYRSKKALDGISGSKIAWPSHPDNENFPMYMVHDSIQDRDFDEVRVGDPIFVTLNGETIYYDGSHGDVVHFIFINEGGYYYESSGTGVGVAEKSAYDLIDGMLLEPCSLDLNVSEQRRTEIVHGPSTRKKLIPDKMMIFEAERKLCYV